MDFWSQWVAHQPAQAKRPPNAIRPTRSVANCEPSPPIPHSPAMPQGESIFVPPEFSAPKHSADPDRLDCLPSFPAAAPPAPVLAILRPARASCSATPTAAGLRLHHARCSFQAAARTALPASRLPQPARQAISATLPPLPPAPATAMWPPPHLPATTHAVVSRARDPSPHGREKHIPRATAAKEPLQPALASEATHPPSSFGQATVPARPAACRSRIVAASRRNATRTASAAMMSRREYLTASRVAPCPAQVPLIPPCRLADRITRARAARQATRQPRPETAAPPNTSHSRKNEDAARLQRCPRLWAWPLFPHRQA